MQQLFSVIVWYDKHKGISASGADRMKFNKVDKLYVHPTVENLKIPGPGLFAYNKAKLKWRVQTDSEYDYENDIVIFADNQESIVQVFRLGLGLGQQYQEYYQEHKSKIILPGR